MAEVLEASMLICFGISWPLSLVKNIKARTAKSMSLQFILLIIVGYIAGISAKLISHRINYVLLVYLFNLAVVSINLLVYFRNRRLDKVAQAMEGKNMIAAQTRERTAIEHEYMQMNTLAQPGGIVFFGSDYLSRLPVSELAQNFRMDEKVYNRSVADVKIADATGMLDVCVTDLAPRKVFVNLGDADLQDPDLDINDFISKYEWLLYTIHNSCQADIYVMSLFSDTPTARQINARLEHLSQECGAAFIDVTPALHAGQPDLYFFEQLKLFIRCHPISFEEAMV